MSQEKIIRTVCLFAKSPTDKDTDRLQDIARRLEQKGFAIQTKRIVSTVEHLDELTTIAQGDVDCLSIGAIDTDQALQLLPSIFKNDKLSFNLELAEEVLGLKHVQILKDIIASKASHTFNFAYTFNNAKSSPYFPSAVYERDGFAIGLQPTDLSQGCETIEDWLHKLEIVWREIVELFSEEQDFLGIDSSIAPLLEGDSSFINFVKRLGGTFDRSVTTDMYTTITRFIKERNPKPVGLCGMMLPCLEDFELAAEYEQGQFSIERNIFLSLHSGLGIDTYPIGVDESPERVLEILKLLQSLSNKYSKPLSARFVSDGKAKVGDRSDFKNQYLIDCTVRPL